MSLLAVVLAGLAVFLVGRPPPNRAANRILPQESARGVSAGEADRGGATRPVPTSATDRTLQGRGRVVTAACAGGSVALLWGGWVGLVLGVAVAGVAERVLRRIEPHAVRERRDRLRADLPMAADLLGACLRGGGAPATAVESVARALGGPLGAELAVVAAALRLGAEPRVAWSAFLDDPVLRVFGAAMARAWDSGAPLAEAMDRVARDARTRRRSQVEQRARAVGVKAAAPLGLCFLPAFLLIGVVPVIIGAVSALLG